jgi:hypothetical protein
VLHQFSDRDNPALVVRRYREAVPSGSYMAMSHLTNAAAPMARAGKALTARGLSVYLRNRDEIARFFAGTELVEPGVVPIDEWRPDTTRQGREEQRIALYGGVGRKP